MKSRSSRLFIVLLHLVGVSTNLPRNSFLAAFFPNGRTVGIVGVHPMAILPEPLELRIAGGLGKLLGILEGAGYDVESTVLGEPYWLQDDKDGKCLGPEGFSDCGDATLWLIRRRPSRTTSSYSSSSSSAENTVGGKNKKKRRGPFSFFQKFDSDQMEDASMQEWEYALQLIDVNSLLPSSSSYIESKSTKQQRRKQKVVPRHEEEECMMITSSREENLTLGTCSSDRAWRWNINGEGVVVWDETRHASYNNIQRERREKGKGKILMGGPFARFLQFASVSGDHETAFGGRGSESRVEGTVNDPSSSTCIWRVNETSSSITAPCDGAPDSVVPLTKSRCSLSPDDICNGSMRVVGFSVIRYQSGAAGSHNLPPYSSLHLAKGAITLSSANAPILDKNETNEDLLSSPPGDERGADSMSKSIEIVPVQEVEPSHLPRTMRTSQSQVNNPRMHPELKSVSDLLYTNVAYHGSAKSQLTHKKATFSDLQDRNPSFDVGGSRTKMKVLGSSSRIHPGGKLLHVPHSPGSLSSSHDDTPHRPRKIPIHPYIAASKDGVWEDPVTGLPYLTDLSGYLGHDRKVTGRHTLMGVGLYVRTMLKIKVYGVALYVPKFDILADSGFTPFATMSAEELARSEEFYNHLTYMSSGPNGGNFDRTIFIKLNMQLSTDTMRASLEADWKLLSPEHKKMLIDSSFKKRPAEAKMLETIRSPENTSRCSCGQTAPEEYQADPSCCARGTELVFTWRKSGDLELRIDGRIMDIFPSPDCAKGIFYEYLRMDDPISPEARQNFADGFPFLLAPLAQVKGISSPVNSQETVNDGTNVGGGHNFGFDVTKVFGHIVGVATGVPSWVQGNVDMAVSNVAKTAQNFGSEIDRRRVWVWNHMITLPDQTSHFLESRTPFGKRRTLSPFEDELRKGGDGRGKVFRPQITKMLGEPMQQTPISDEIGIIIEPTMNLTHTLFFLLVHFYLMLLLIVSLPGSYNTRLVVKRSGASTLDSESDNEERNSCKDAANDDHMWVDHPIISWCGEMPIQNKIKNDVEVDEVNPNTRENRSPQDMTAVPKTNMKKALSYFL